MAMTGSDAKKRTWDFVLVIGVGLILTVSGALLFAEIVGSFCLFQPGYVCAPVYNGAGSLAVFIFLVGVVVLVAGIVWALRGPKAPRSSTETR